MKVKITSERRANGTFIIETWPETGLTVAHGPVAEDKAVEFANSVRDSIIAQTHEQNRILGAMVLTESERAFLAPKEEGWLAKRRKKR